MLDTMQSYKHKNPLKLCNLCLGKCATIFILLRSDLSLKVKKQYTITIGQYETSSSYIWGTRQKSIGNKEKISDVYSSESQIHKEVDYLGTIENVIFFFILRCLPSWICSTHLYQKIRKTNNGQRNPTYFFSAKSASLWSPVRMPTMPSNLTAMRRMAISPFQRVFGQSTSTLWFMGRLRWFLKTKQKLWWPPCSSITVTSQVWMNGWTLPPKTPWRKA